jgi:DNA-binding response OmpR family regulator
MQAILLVNPTEELQGLADDLVPADWSVTISDLSEAAQRLSEEGPFDALLLNLTEDLEQSAVRTLLRAEVVGDRLAVIALVRPQQLADLDSALAVDDFIVHPVQREELAARIRRALRRHRGVSSENAVRCGDLLMDLANYKVFVAERPVDLTYKEYELLRFLATHRDQVCTRETILNRVWGYDFYGGARTVDVHIRRLRSKIEGRGHTFIETVRNVGYRFRAD